MDCRRFRLRFRLAATAAMVVGCAGCLMSPQLPRDSMARAETSNRATSAANDPTNASSNAANAETTGPTPADLNAVLAQVHELGRHDPAAQQALLEDLKNTDPSLWPQLAHAFRTSLAYRQQSAERAAGFAQQNSAYGHHTGRPLLGNPPDVTTEIKPASPFYNTAYSMLQEPPAQTLPTAVDGALLPAAPSTEFAANYPNTQLPEVQLATADVPSAESDAPSSDVSSASSNEIANSPSADWHAQLAAAIRTLEARCNAGVNSSPSAADQATLRMLYLAAGRQEDALQPIAGIAGAEHEFWSNELAGLATVLDDQAGSAAGQRTAEAARHFQQAAMKLGQSAPLAVRNLAFCTEVSSFGVYKPFAAYRFKPGQQVLLYAEVENFVSEVSEKGHHTSLRSNYEILDNNGKRVAGEDFGTTEEYCRNPRRDFFVRYFLRLPKPLPPGRYTLRLTIEDTQSGKSNHGTISFRVGDGG